MNWAKRHLRLLAFLLLAAITGYGLSRFFTGDWRVALGFWEGKGGGLAGALALQVANVLLDAVVWLWILTHFDIRLEVRLGSLVFLAGFAGLLAPAQLGRLVRADAIVRLGRGTLANAVKAEIVFLFLCAMSALALVVGMAGFAVHPALLPLGVVVVVFTILLTADRLMTFVPRLNVQLPQGYWRRPAVVAMASLTLVGWVINGTVLYLVASAAPGGVRYADAVLASPANMLLGMATGLPGGIGAVEGFLGVSLRLMAVPPEHLALAVGAFRLITFWLWIPIGWLALSVVNRVAMRASGSAIEEAGDDR